VEDPRPPRGLRLLDTGLGLIAQTGCDVGHRPDGRIVKTGLEMCDSEVNVVPKPGGHHLSVSAPMASLSSARILRKSSVGCRC
jgi:hypothetical protein